MEVATDHKASAPGPNFEPVLLLLAFMQLTQQRFPSSLKDIQCAKVMFAGSRLNSQILLSQLLLQIQKLGRYVFVSECEQQIPGVDMLAIVNMDCFDESGCLSADHFAVCEVDNSGSRRHYWRWQPK